MSIILARLGDCLNAGNNGDHIRFLLSNKVLYKYGLIVDRIKNTSIWKELSMRRKAQVDAMVSVARIANELGVRILFVKTLRFPGYVPDDIDILVIDRDLVNELVKTLMDRKGYMLRKRGTPEVTLRKIIPKGTYVDLDIHVEMAAGTYTYLDAEYLWRNRTETVLGGERIPVPAYHAELLIAAGHAVMKEFVITLADLVQYEYLAISDPYATRKGLKEAEKLGLLTAYTTLWSALGRALKSDCRYLLSFPRRVPPPVIIMSYMENFARRTGKEGFKPLIQLAKLPSSKGIRTLIDYITGALGA